MNAPTSFINIRSVSAAALAAVICFTLAATDGVTEANLHQTFKVTNGGQFILEADRGGIEVVTGPGTDVDVQVNRSVTRWTGAKAAEVLARHEVTFVQDGNKIEVKARLKKEGSDWLNRDDSGLRVEYIVTVPKQFNLNLRTAGGNVKVANLTGELKASTAGGSLMLAKVEGHVTASTAGGNISLEGATGPASLKSSGGNIHLGELGSETLAETAGGSIDVKLARGKLTTKTSGGSITIHEAYDTLNARTAGGSITASLLAQPKEDCELITAAGSVHLKLNPALSFSVDAHTTAGGVRTELPVTGGENKHGSLQGKINNGGTGLKLRSSAGSVSIEKSDATPKTGWISRSTDHLVLGRQTEQLGHS